MTQGPMNQLLRHLRRAAHAGKPCPSDGELLACFIERREETAFAALLSRHGPMVLGVCRRILGNVHEAEDAFQATFLVLVRKAAAIRPREAVGNWLYGVAYRTALEARARLLRRYARERELVDIPHGDNRPDDCWFELRAVLDQELHRLPDKYRLAVVLCDVEGRSRKEVARRLAIPEGTLSSRLATARKKLSARLVRHGFTLTGTALAGLLATNAASACVPASLLQGTTRAAVFLAAEQTIAAGVVSATVTALTEGVLKTMFVAKIKTTLVVLCGVAALGLGTGGVLYQTRAGAADDSQAGQQKAAQSNTKKALNDLNRKEAAERESLLALAEELRAQEQLLRDELQKVRQEALQQRQRAEIERKRAEEAIAELKEQLKRAYDAELEAKKKAEKILYEANVREAQRAAKNQAAPDPRPRPGNAADAKLRDKLALVREDYELQRHQLQEKLRELQKQYERSQVELTKMLAELEVRQKKEIIDLEKELLKLSGQFPITQPKQPDNRAQPSGDKLDRILDRLEQIERRLERLEHPRGLNERRNQ